MQPRLRALSGLLADPNPQVRYLAARFMVPVNLRGDEATSEAWWSVPEIKERLLRTTKDDDPEIAALAVISLAQYKEKDVAKSIVAMLPTARPNDFLCGCVIRLLEDIGDPLAIEALAKLCEDSRWSIRHSALMSLAKFSQPEAQSHLWRLSESTDRNVRTVTIGAINRNCVNGWWSALDKKACREKCDAIFLERVESAALPFEVRLSHAAGIERDERQLKAGAPLLAAADSAAKTNAVLICLTHNYLKQHGVEAVGGLPNIISNTTMQAELSLAVKEANMGAVRQTLIAIFSAATNSPESKVSRFAERALHGLQEETEPHARGRR